MEKQGVVFSGRLAPILDSINFIRAMKGKSDRSFFITMIDKAFKDRPKIPELVGLFLFGMPVVVFNKAEHLDELYVTKN